MIIGELYLVKSYFWLMFPSLEIVTDNKELLANISLSYSGATKYANHYSNRLNCKINVVSQNDVFILLKIQEYKNSTIIKVLSTKGELGWLIISHGSYCFELLKDKQTSLLLQ